jgi:ABC-type multidrug transport system fused ATPase/permease subunit
MFFIKALLILYILEWVFDWFVMNSLYYIAPNFSEYATGTMFEFIIDNYELDFENIPIGEILSKIIRIPNILFEYINLIKVDILRYVFVYFTAMFHFYSISYDILIIYIIVLIVNFIYIGVMITQYNIYEVKGQNLQDHIYELLIDCLNNMTSVYAFNQVEEEKKFFYNKIFFDYKQVLFKLRELSLHSSYFWGICSVIIFIVLNYSLYQSYLKKQINAEQAVSTFIIIFSLIRMLDNGDKISHSISRINSQINDAETFFNNISSFNRNEMKMNNKNMIRRIYLNCRIVLC